MSADRAAMVETVRRMLIERGAIMHPPAGDAAVQAAEQKLGIRLPDALRQIYRAFGGSSQPTACWRWDFWSPDRLETKPIGSKLAGESLPDWSMYLIFCDVLIWLPAFAVCVDPRRAGDTEVLAYCADRCYKCAPSLDAFLERLPQQGDDFFMDSMEE